MSEPIKAGDLVQIVRGMGCCGHETGNEGKIFAVSSLVGAGENCKWCKRALPSAANGLPDCLAITVDRLKRIPPLSELGDVEHKEEQHA